MNQNFIFVYLSVSCSCGPIHTNPFVQRTEGIAKYSRAGGWSALTSSSYLLFAPDIIVVVVSALHFSRGILYIGGQFAGASEIPETSANVISYHPANDSFVRIGSLNKWVTQILSHPVSGLIYVNGFFTVKDQFNKDCSSIAFWNQSEWRGVGQINGYVSRMTFNGSQLWIVGQFSRIQGGEIFFSIF